MEAPYERKVPEHEFGQTLCIQAHLALTVFYTRDSRILVNKGNGSSGVAEFCAGKLSSLTFASEPQYYGDRRCTDHFSIWKTGDDYHFYKFRSSVQPNINTLGHDFEVDSETESRGVLNEDVETYYAARLFLADLSIQMMSSLPSLGAKQNMTAIRGWFSSTVKQPLLNHTQSVQEPFEPKLIYLRNTLKEIPDRVNRAAIFISSCVESRIPSILIGRSTSKP